MALTQALQWTEAERVISTIEDSFKRVEALCTLAEQLARSREHEQLLHVIQRSWWLAKTRAETLGLFPMATQFIPLHPELGMVFYGAFTWVDYFYKRP